MKKDQYMQGYSDGIYKALQIVQKEGAEALEREVRFRGLTGINTKVSQNELLQASQHIKELTLKTVLTMATMVLRDEFGFGCTRGNRFVRRFNEKTACLVDDFVSWQDMIDTIKAEMGIDVGFKDDELQQLRG